MNYISPMSRYPISFSTLGCPKWSWRTVIDTAARLGYAGIELRGLEGEMDLTKRPEFGARQIATSIADLKALDLVVTNLGASTRLHEPGPAIAAQMDEARRFVDLAHRLGARWVRVFPDRFVAGEPRERTIARVGDNLAALGRFARGSGVGILVESHGEFVDSDSLEAMMRAAGDAPGVGILWDAHHTVSAGREAPAATWARLGRWVHHTHLKDSVPAPRGVRYVLTGEGTIGVRDVVRVLAAAGYEGYYGFEWEKQWHPDIADPEIAFPHYAELLGTWLGDAGVSRRAS
jgi:sugar phosphate isomerase/epimerase